MRTVDLFRHTDNDGDALTPEGVEAAERVGRELLTPPYDAYVSSGAARATQMLEILRRAAGQEAVPITAEPGLRSAVEDRWRDVAKAAGKGADLEAFRDRDPDLVDKESWLLGRGLRRVVEQLPEGGRALVVGHSPTNEAAVLGLTGNVVPPLGKGEGVTVVERDGRYTAEVLGGSS
jgi:broad specificity phosphatase PhoE